MTDAPKEIFIILTEEGGSLSDCLVSEKAVIWESHEACIGKYIRADIAADRIKQLEAENAELRNALQHEKERKRQAVDDALFHLRQIQESDDG